MNNLESKLPTQFFGFPPGTSSGLASARRLIVLFPASQPDILNLSHGIWEIARSYKLDVLLLGLFDHDEDESQLRLKMVNMAAMIKDPGISAEIMVEHGNDWVKHVKNIFEISDIVACYTDHRVGLMRKPLDQVLRSNFDIPIYLLAGFQPIKITKPKFSSQFFSWSGSLAIIGGFFWVELKLTQLPQDWGHTTLIYACIFMEIPFILLWNSLFT